MSDEPNSDSLQSQGGKARAAKLSKEERKAIAQKAAQTRWGANKPLKATHKGSFKDEFGVDAECYILDDVQKTAVISQRGLGRAIGLKNQSGAALTRFLETKAMYTRGAEIREKLAHPLVFQWKSPGAETPPGDIYGFDAAILIDICRAITDAEKSGDLGKRGEDIAAQAHIILNASAKAGIQNLVYALSGYNPTAQEVIAAFKMYVQEEARKYEKEFPPELYQEWYRLYKIEPIKGRGRPWQFKTLTVDHIYTPLARSNGKILELTRALKANDGDRKKKLFQFLTEVGTRALRFQLGRVYQIACEAQTDEEYQDKIAKTFGGQLQLPIDV